MKQKLTNFVEMHGYTTLLYTVYLLVSVATFRHSAEGFASIEGGIAWGMLSALAIDAGMILSATGLRKKRSVWLLVGLLVSAAASTYTQLLFAMSHSTIVDVAPGAEWTSKLALTIIRVRVFVLPAILPLLAIVYAFATEATKHDGSTELDEKVSAVLATHTTKSARVRGLLELRSSLNGNAGELSDGRIIELAGCSKRLLTKVKGEAG